MSRINNVWQLYLTYGLISGIGISGIYIGILTAITKIFTTKEGLANGIIFSGIGFGYAIVTPIMGQLITRFGWRVSIFILGLFTIVCLMALLQFVKMGNKSSKLPEKGFFQVQELTFKKAISSREFWVLSSIWFILSLFNQITNAHLINFATELNITIAAAATIFTIIGLTGMATRPFIGLVADRYGYKNILVVGTLIITIAFFTLTLKLIHTLYLFGILFGVSSGIMLLLAPLISTYFGKNSLGTIIGAITLASTMGGAIGPILAGWIHDLTGNYSYSFMLCGLLGIICAIFIKIFIKPVSMQVS